MDKNLFEDLLKYEDTELRPYQIQNKKRIYELWKTCRAVMLQMPTGTGKTRLFVSILRDLHKYAAEHKNPIRVLILVHRVELIDQISEELGVRYGLAHGFIHSQDRERRKFPFQIASVQTLSRRLVHWTDYNFDFIIVDEAHHVLADSYKTIIQTFSDAKVLGVTATPYRLSGAGFKPEFDQLIVSDSIREFINKGYLSDYEYYSIRPHSYIENQLENIQKKDASGDYDNTEIMKVCDKDKIRAEVVNTYLQYANGKKGIVYSINKKHNKHLCDAFCAANIPAVTIDSDTNVEEREKLIEDFKRGKIKVLCNVDIFSEGFDCPDIEFVQLARPTKSLSLYLQQIGRGLRISEGKQKAIFLDNVGLYNRFGVPSANRYWNEYFVGIEGLKEPQRNLKKSENVEIIHRHSETDLSEGKEKVHLIHSSLDDDYEYERANLVWKFYDSFFSIYFLMQYNKKYDYIYQRFISTIKDTGIKIIRIEKLVSEIDTRIILSCLNDYENLMARYYHDLINFFSEKTSKPFTTLNVEVIDDTYFSTCVKSTEIDSIDKYVMQIQCTYEKYMIDYIFKNREYVTQVQEYKRLYRDIIKNRIGIQEFSSYLFSFDCIRFITEEKRKRAFGLWNFFLSLSDTEITDPSEELENNVKELLELLQETTKEVKTRKKEE